MILKELLDFFDIEVSLPEYLYEESFNEIFLKGDFTRQNATCKIVAETQKDVIHTMIIDADDEYPVVVSSLLPNGKRNGIKFGKSKGDLKYI